MPAKERQDGKTLAQIDALHVERYRWASSRVRGTQVLDCACGVGYGSKLIAEDNNGVKVTGMDNSVAAIKHAKKYFAHLRVSYILRDMQDLKLGDRLFDTIVSLESLEHVANPGIVLEQFANNLQQDGRLIVSLPIFPTVKRNKFHLFEVPNRKAARTYFQEQGFLVQEEQIQDSRFGLFLLGRST